MSYDPVAALGTLNEHDVRFVVIGGVAGRLWGSPTLTNDVDICYERSLLNLERLASALRDLGATLRGVDENVRFQLDAKTLECGSNFTFTTRLGPVDVIGLPAGVRDFSELAANAVRFDLGGGVSVDVCDLEDLIRMKRASGRPKDRIELEVLGAVRDERSDLEPH
jgi:predicted nucleotidyltransferase